MLSRAFSNLGATRVPCHTGFYQAIPDTQELPEALWDRPSKLAGINMNAAMQLDLIRNIFQIPGGTGGVPGRAKRRSRAILPQQWLFDGMDAFIAYCVVRHFQPRLIVKVGSGFSSLILGEALARNSGSSLIFVEP